MAERGVCSQIKPVLAANSYVKDITDSVCKSITPACIGEWNALAKCIRTFPYDQLDSNKMFGIASQISPVIDNLNIAGLTSNIERIYDHGKHQRKK